MAAASSGVVPLVGTWIEIAEALKVLRRDKVVPLVGTWIEICRDRCYGRVRESCPSWARGLKCPADRKRSNHQVVPLVGTWIEILAHSSTSKYSRRAPRGHVD